MTHHDKDDTEQKELTPEDVQQLRLARVSCVFPMIYGGFIVFAFMGQMLNKAAAPYVLIFTCFVWVATRICSEAWAAIKSFRAISDTLSRHKKR